MLDKKTRSYVLFAIIAHLVVSVWHGVMHGKVPVPMLDYQALFVYGIVMLVPIIAIILLFTRLQNTGVLLAGLAIFAAFIFGLIHHFVMISPDNIWHQPVSPHNHGFSISATILAITDFICGLYCLLKSINK